MKENNTFGKVSLILGIIGTILFPLVLSTLAIIFGAIGMNKGQKYSQAGLILGIIGWCIMILLVII